MPVRMDVLHFTMSVLLLLGANSNGRILTHKDEPPIWGSPSQLLASMDEGPNNNFPHPSRFIRKLELAPSPESGIPSSPNCSRSGVFAIQGTCRGFYMCRPLSPDSGVYSMSLRSCSPDSIFDDISAACLPSSQAITRPECKDQASKRNNFVESEGDEGVKVVRSLVDTSFDRSTSLRRQKRDLLFSSGSSARDFIFKAENVVNGASIFMGGETNLNRIENKLIGCQGKLNNSSLPVLESQAATKIFAEITQLIADTRLSNIQRNFDKIQTLLRGGILEDHAITAVLQGMISNENKMNKFNLAVIKVTLKEVENFINMEINKSKPDLRQGFELLSDSINVSGMKPVVSELLTLIKEFKLRLNHLQSLPEGKQESEIERSGGYLAYLQPPTLQDTLYVNIDRAIPSSASDKTGLAMLDLLVEGLKIHANLLSFAVSANVFSAEKALRNRDIEEFNTRMIRVESVLSRVNALMLGTISSPGANSTEGLLSKINSVLNKASGVDGLTTSLSGKRDEVAQVESDIKRLIEEGNTIVIKPDTITREPDFSISSIPLPVGQWETEKQVSYAMQFVSRNGLSKLSDWSSPYKIQDKAHPIVHIPTTETSMPRLVYRRFNQDKPELVAILTDKRNSFRDIDKDLITVVSKTNLADAVGKVRALLNDGANVNVIFENNMTPLHYAAKYDNVNVMEILISENATVSAKSLDDEEPLHLAALFDAKDAIRNLVDNGANVDAKTNVLGLSPLHIAVANNHELTAEVLINSEASVNIKDNNGLSPLHYAVAGNEEALNLLLESDLDINAVTKSGLTPMHVASAVSNGLLVLKLLQLKNINVVPLPDSQLSLVHLASIYDNAGAIGSMMQHGLAISVPDKDGSIPLHYTAFYDNLMSVVPLVETNPMLRSVLNKDNKTALDVARDRNSESIANILGADIENLSKVMDHELEILKNKTDIFSKSTYYNLTAHCSDDISELIVKSTDEICKNVGYVDSYVNLVKFMIPLKKYYEGQDTYTGMLGDYDRDLETAQDHAKLWRDGDSIVNGIRQTFNLAKKFEPEFSRKNVISKRNIKNIKRDKKKYEQLEETQKEIAEVKKLIDGANKLIKENPNLPPLVHEAMLAPHQKKLANLEHKFSEDSVIMRELEELEGFLNFVKNDAGVINATASETKEKIETFMNYLKTDKTAFIRHGNVSRTALKRLEQESAEKGEELDDIKKKKEELEGQVKEGEKQMDSLYAKIEESQRNFAKAREEAKEKRKTAKYLTIFGGVFSFVPLLGSGLSAAGGVINSDATQLMQDANDNTQLISQLNATMFQRREQMKDFQKLLVDGSTKSDALRKQRYQLIYINQDLNTVKSNSDALVKALTKALAGVTSIGELFNDITLKLTVMIEKAQEAGDAAARKEAQYFIYEEIKGMECAWMFVYNSITDLDYCTRNFEILNLN